MASVLFALHFHDEQAAYAFIEARLWPEGPICPHCGKVNEVTASEVPAGQEISCSACSAPLGTWRDLRVVPKPRRAGEPTAA